MKLKNKKRILGGYKMKLLQTEDLQFLINYRNPHCVSMYVPTHQKGTDTKEDPIRFKNMLRELKKEIFPNQNIDAEKFKKELAQAQALLDDHDFWLHQGSTLAIFMAPGLFRYYRLPIESKEYIAVTDSFRIKPLIKLFTGSGRFFLLTLNQKDVQLYEGSSYTLRPVPFAIPSPHSIEELMQYDIDEKHIQARSFGRVNPQGFSQSRATAGTSAQFHGQGVTHDLKTRKKEILQLLQATENATNATIGGQYAPLILAGVEYIRAMYTQHNSYKHTIQDAIDGNTELLNLDQLHHKAWNVAEPFLQHQVTDRLDAFNNLSNTERTSTDIHNIFPAAHQGRIHTLFINPDVFLWGQYDETDRAVYHRRDPIPGDQDLIDLAAIHTLMHQGQVFSVTHEDLPDRAVIAAIFRY